MKLFKKKNYFKDRIVIVSCLVFCFVCLFLFYFSENLSPGIIKISKLKVNEVTTNIINDAIFNYRKSDVALNNLIVTQNNSNGEIITIDVDMEQAYILMENIVEEIRANIKKFQEGDYKYYNMESLSTIENGMVISLPLGAVTGKNLVVNLGPKIPVKLSLLENVKANIKTEVKEYGINNSLVNIYLKLNIEQNIEMPSSTDSFYNDYEMLLASKLVQGTVPDFFGGYKEKETEIVNIPVN